MNEHQLLILNTLKEACADPIITKMADERVNQHLREIGILASHLLVEMVTLPQARSDTTSQYAILAQGIVPDVAVAQGDEEQLTKIERPSEADLPGHLNNDAASKNKKQNVIRPPAGKKVDDFQLAYALGLMNGKPPVLTAQAQGKKAN